MIRFQKFIGIFLILFSSSLYASFPQSIQVCLGVQSNGASPALQAKFVSSDLFDRGVATNAVRPNTSICVEHKYNYGPKNIRLTVETLETSSLKEIAFFPDTSCAHMQKKKNATFQSRYLATKDRREVWDFILKQIESRNGFKYAYQLSCNHVSY